VKFDCRNILSNRQTQPDLRNFKLGNFRQSTRSFNQMSSEIFLAGVEVQLDKRRGRILLGDNTGNGAVMLRPIRFQCAFVSPGLPCIGYTYVYS
jgi:hypothetical protein